MKILAMLGALAMAACVQTSEMPLSANAWQIEASGRGAIAAAGTNDALLRRAAEITLREGFTHFVLAAPSSQNDRRFTGFVYGSPFTPMYARDRTSTATVIMFRQNDPEAQQALDAQAMLDRLS